MMTLMIAPSESFSDKLSGVCRLCLREDGPMSSIFATPSGPRSDDHQDDVLAARITSIAQVQINPNDGLPASICHVCRQQVDKFYDFRLLVEISDRKLRSCLEDPQESSGFGRIIARASQDGKAAEYEEFTVESASDERDLLSVNAILVPSTSGMQVWQICNVEDEEIATAMPESANVRPKLEYRGETDDSDLDDFEGVKRCLAEAVGPLAIGLTRGHENELYFATAPSSGALDEEETTTSGKLHGEIADEGIYEEEHLMLEEFSCQLCLKSFPTLEALKNHVSEHFLGEKRPKTSAAIASASRRGRQIDVFHDCEAAETEGGVRIDENEAIATDPCYLDSLNCESCDENFETMEERLNHARRHLRDVKCRHCDKSFVKSWSLKEHEENIHGTRSAKTHRCDDCGREFAKRSELRYHKGTHTDSPSTCTICNKHFRNVQSFKMHLKRHTLGSRYNCPDCGKSYYTNSELARHVQQHTGLREFPCARCDMSFLSKPELNRHVKYHNGTKKFECKVCLKTYYESGHLKVHERVHTGERPFACTVCEKGFITKSKLVRHFKIHERTARNSEQESANVCEQFKFVE